MIQLLATKYQKRIAFLLFLLFEQSFLLSTMAHGNAPRRIPVISATRAIPAVPVYTPRPASSATMPVSPKPSHALATATPAIPAKMPRRQRIGGPTQPEMSSFRSVNADNMVNLFTGDFSYNIPLLDVGGYPVNIYYTGGVGVEQEASWVGLGWNINPGNINRNMRGVPDDFNGDETLIQQQNMKPNKTWGASIGPDLELTGLKQLGGLISVDGRIGVSFNNYLGPALDLGVKGGVEFSIVGKTLTEKNNDGGSLALKAGIGLDANSRSGLTISPNVSLTARLFGTNQTTAFGVGAVTSYNSRAGVKQMQISEQMSFNKTDQECKIDMETGKTSKRDKMDAFSAGLSSSTISFAKPSYIPSIRIPLTNEAISGHFQLGFGNFGVFGSVEAEVYQQISSVSTEKVEQKRPMIGYLYYDKALSRSDAVMDFTRFNDKEVTPNTPIISAAQYSYDVFSIQGEGSGGSIRAYRNDLGYVRDNLTGSQDKSNSFGLDIGPIGHFGANFNTISTPSTIGEWNEGNKLRTAIPFKAPVSNSSWENVYFRNPGESSVLDNDQFARIGGADLVRFRLSGGSRNPAVDPVLDRFSRSGALLGQVNVTGNSSTRKKRIQVIDFLTATDASQIGLDKSIKNYSIAPILDNNNSLLYTPIDRVSEGRKGHHISQINVTESNGKRYVYGIPVYNITQKDFTFTVKNSDNTSPNFWEKVSYEDKEQSATENPSLTGGSDGREGYVQITETPAYAHSFLLSGLLSPDYVDVTGDGITEDDLGTAVKFNYSRISKPDGSAFIHRWRTPTNDYMANFNAGKRSDLKDDKGVMSYGERESWYMHSIESKTMIAIFLLEDRADGKGVGGENGGIDVLDKSIKRLKEIRLYSKSDLKANGLDKAKPIKTVHFVYSYRLCQDTPDNPDGDGTSSSKGKLTLESIYFTFNGQERNNKNQYVFSYLNDDGSGNPLYAPSASDRWGTYKPLTMNPLLYPGTEAHFKNSEFPFTPQDQAGQTSSPKGALDINAGAWSLKKILLPSGGQINVQYESDDYAYVQNRRAADMMTVAGFGNKKTVITNRLYDVNGQGVTNNDYLFISVPEPCKSAAEVYQKYLQGMDQIAVRLAVNMPKGIEFLTSYARMDVSSSSIDVPYGVYDAKTIWIRLKEVNGISPLSLTAIEFLREQLPGQAFPGYDVSDASGLQQVGEMLVGLLDGIKNAFRDPVSSLRSAGKAQRVTLSQTFARLNDPDGFKYGGGYRVRSVTLKDNWEAMTGQYTSTYGQTYDYTTTEVFNGSTRTISSGVASYEPSIGGEENPFQTIKMVADKLPLGPTSYGAVELPVLDAFFPAPLVGYSKVTVRSVTRVKPAIQKKDVPQKSRSGIGRQVTEFYTTKDFPVYYSETSFDPSTDKQAHDASTAAFFYKYAYDSRALSQGFLVETNDMHGKLRSQSSYADNDTTLRVNYTENFYRNTGSRGLNEQFDFVSAAQGGTISSGNMGIDIELMTDTRQFTVKSNSKEIQGQVDLFPIIIPIWIPFIWPVFGNSENTYRAVTTTKVINYHSIVDSVVVFDKGSMVSTKNLVYDAETGEVIVNRTNNEFNLPVYTTSYPAWWAYSGMGLAYTNIGATYSGVNFFDGKIISSGIDQNAFESGDELYITDFSASTQCLSGTAESQGYKVWAFDRNKNNTALTVPAKDLIFIDKNGRLFTQDNVTFRIVRSGRRNLLDAKAAAITAMNSPVVSNGNTRKLVIDNTSKVLQASAVEFREKWQTDKGVINRLALWLDPSCNLIEIQDCNGYLEKKINPYLKGLVGNFRPVRDLVFYGDRTGSELAAETNLPQNGFLADFSPYWNFNAQQYLVPATDNAQWVWKTQTTKLNARGMEVEARNALNIYTAAQYGFNKNLPLAITENGRSWETAYEGFEDLDFKTELISGLPAQCVNRHVDYGNTTNATPFNTDGAGFSAHTGKVVLKVNAQSTGIRTFPIISAPIDDFSAKVEKLDTAKNIVNVGVNLGTVTHSPVKPPFPIELSYSQTTGERWKFSEIQDTSYRRGAVLIREFNYNVPTYYYLNIPSTQTISLIISATSSTGSTGVYSNNANCAFTITTIDGAFQITPTQVSSNTAGNTRTDIYSICIPKGLYRIDAAFFGSGSYSCNTQQTSCVEEPLINATYGMNFSNAAGATFPYYKDVTMVNGCISTIPMAGTDSMMNASFAIPANKKMLISAWVREECGTPCTLTTYANNSIQVSDGVTSNTMTPTGPIIEGWQRYEGTYTAAATASNLSLYFKNNSTSPIYFDDIRIHPFNANMKSYVYDPVNLRLIAELDANNYATFYEYDEEGTLIRTKAETREGIKTIKETRSAKQKNLTTTQ